jgi:uncharacterized membrane protein
MASIKRRIQEAFQNSDTVYLVWARDDEIKDVSVLPGKLVRITTAFSVPPKTDYVVKGIGGQVINTTTITAFVLCLTHAAAAKAVKMLLEQLQDGKGVTR